MPRLHSGWVVLAVGLLCTGCGTKLKELRRHPQEERLERILATIVPHTKYPDRHYWVRVSETDKEHPVGLAVLPQRHIYITESLLEQADDVLVTTLVAHGLAHHRLHHQGKRSIGTVIQKLAFKAGGVFVPGLSQGSRIGGPLTEVALSAGQEPSADERTIQYLEALGYSVAELLNALEYLVDHGYAERVGRVSSRDRKFINRISELRQHR